MKKSFSRWRHCSQLDASTFAEKIGMFDTDVEPHNMVLSNYEGKIGHALGVIQVNLTVGSITRPTMFMVIQAKTNYNLLLGREWIHGIGEVPSSLHHRV